MASEIFPNIVSAGSEADDEFHRDLAVAIDFGVCAGSAAADRMLLTASRAAGVAMPSIKLSSLPPLC